MDLNLIIITYIGINTLLGAGPISLSQIILHLNKAFSKIIISGLVKKKYQKENILCESSQM